MDLVQRGTSGARRVALLPAAWNPPTLAHLALADGALDFADEVLLVLPRVFPHKEFEHVGFDLRLQWLQRTAACRRGLGVGVTQGGLFIDMARALRAADSQIEQVFIVCGSDAAQRFVDWPYDRPPCAIEQLTEFSLLVAPRGQPFIAPYVDGTSIHELPLDSHLQRISSTEIRERIRSGKPWTHLVPDEIAGQLGAIYH